MRTLILSFACFSFFACSRTENSVTTFTSLPASRTGVFFENTLAFDSKFNIYTYRNFFNGGGVATGDINNDGLQDLYFTGNQVKNALFLNKGGMKFEDITSKAGVEGKQGWSTGVTMADVNGDGLLDIYVCNSGNLHGDSKKNELFINNGNLTFSEKAEEFGLDDEGYSTHASFFDFDRDGDLDMYLLNNSFQAIGSFNLEKNERNKRDPQGGDKLFRNDGSRFVDVSEEAGIFGSVIGFGLGVTVGDINSDGWLDIYVSNDFFERDYLYINQQNGKFKEDLTSQMRSICAASMGSDLADINNDGLLDLFVTDMLPADNKRIKTVTTFEDWNKYRYNLRTDYYHQFTRNTFQLNNGNGTFSEVGRLLKVEATDWSWGALIADFNNDGLKDLFVSNGISRDLTNQDYLQFASSEQFVQEVVRNDSVNYRKLVEAIPTNPVSNFVFCNNGNYSFSNKTQEWGLDLPSFSSGAAYSDLDNDGDLDLIVNNVDMPAFIFQNNTSESSKNGFLKFKLNNNNSKNTNSIGAKVFIFIGGVMQTQEVVLSKGFQSSIDSRLNFGVGLAKVIDSVIIQWPSGVRSKMLNVKPNNTVEMSEPLQTAFSDTPISGKKILKFVDVSAEIDLNFRHNENEFIDFDRDRLIFHSLSTEGPKVSIRDFNKDGLEDFFIGGAKGQPGGLFAQDEKGRFERTNQDLFSESANSEDLGSLFFDANNDSQPDLYVCSGGNDFEAGSPFFANRLYLNAGEGNYIKSGQPLPTEKLESTSCVKAADFDDDGDLDLLVGVRLTPFAYGFPGNCYILQNDGTGFFKDVTDRIAPSLKGVGMVTDVEWCDIDGDKDMDLVVVGEYMKISVFINDKQRFINKTKDAGLEESNGWWNVIKSADIDKDGDIDFVVGNHGLNSRFRASSERPITMWVNDFDKNGSIEQVICTYYDELSFPMPLRHDLISQIPSLKKKFLKYESYKDATIYDVFSQDQLKNSLKLEATNLASSILINDGKGHFAIKSLPMEAQFSPVYGILIDDIDIDGNLDLMLGGNLYRVKPEVGRYDASYGTFLKGDGFGNFVTVPNRDCGLKLDGEVRDIKRIKVGKNNLILVTRNNDTPIFLKVNE